jgi:hypothetical protein
MSFEVSCGQCQGRLLVAEVGVVVACPHCGSHLTVGTAPDQNETPTLSAPAQPEAIAPAPVESLANVGSPAGTGFPSFAASPGEAPSFGNSEIPEFVPASPDAPIIQEQPLVGAADQPMAELEPFPATQSSDGLVEDSVNPATAPLEAAVTQPTNDGNVIAPAATSYAGRKSDTVPRNLFILVLSYASAITIVVAFLVWTRVLSPSVHGLESLPDIEPKRKDKKIAYEFVPWKAKMAPGHELKLGEERRFGNLKVTATKVTREDLSFEHFQGIDDTRETVKSVLKLWLKFENVSEDQAIAPLRGLVFYRTPGKDFDHERSNNFVCKVAEKDKGDDGDFTLMYELNTDDVWNLAGQDINHEIPAGESIETYVATVADGAKKFPNTDNDLVWRVHFRKGYSSKKFGVTTVVEVAFNDSEIQDGAKPAADKDADEKSKA